MHEILCAQDNFNAVREALEKSLGQPVAFQADVAAQTTTPVEGETVQTLFDLIAALEDNDDVQNVYANFEASDERWRSSRPEAAPMRLIGLDPGLRLTGWGVIESRATGCATWPTASSGGRPRAPWPSGCGNCSTASPPSARANGPTRRR